MEKNTKPGPKLLSPYPAKIENHIKNTYSNLSEKDRRAYAAIEALKLPRGAIAITGHTLVFQKIPLISAKYRLNRKMEN